MAEFSLNDMEQAKRRVQDMQQRAKSLAGAGKTAERLTEYKSPPKTSAEPVSIEEKLLGEKKSDKPCDKSDEKVAGLSCPPSFSIGNLGNDRALILLLLLLLWGEKCDKLLLLALLYCAM